MGGITVKNMKLSPTGRGKEGGIKHVTSTVVKSVCLFVCVSVCLCVVRLGSSYRHVVELGSCYRNFAGSYTTKKLRERES